MNRPAEVASEPPAEFLAAPVAAPSYSLPAWAVQDGDAPPIAGLPVPRLDHDEYAPDQSYDDDTSTAKGILTPHLAMAMALAAAKAIANGTRQARAEAQRAEAEAQRLRDEVKQLRNERDFPELAGPALWRSGEFKHLLSDTFVGGIPVVLDEHGLVKAAWAEPGETP